MSNLFLRLFSPLFLNPTKDVRILSITDLRDSPVLIVENMSRLISNFQVFDEIRLHNLSQAVVMSSMLAIDIGYAKFSLKQASPDFDQILAETKNLNIGLTLVFAQNQWIFNPLGSKSSLQHKADYILRRYGDRKLREDWYSAKNDSSFFEICQLLSRRSETHPSLKYIARQFMAQLADQVFMEILQKEPSSEFFMFHARLSFSMRSFIPRRDTDLILAVEYLLKSVEITAKNYALLNVILKFLRSL